MSVSSYFPPPEVGAPGSAKQSRLIADIYLGRWAEGDGCSGSCVPERIFSRLGGTAPRSRDRGILSSKACRRKDETKILQQAMEQKPESKKQLGSVESEEGDRCLREEEGGRGPMRQLRAWRVAGPEPDSAPRTLTRPARCVIRPDCCCCQLGRRVAEDAYIGEERGRSPRRLLK